MKVSPIKNNTNKSSRQQENKYQTKTFCLRQNDSAPSFKAGLREALMASRTSDLNLLGCSEAKLIDIAEDLHRCADYIIQEVSTVEKWFIFNYEDKEASQQAYKRLSEAIKKVIDNKLQITNRISKIETKKALGLSNYSDQIQRIGREFIDLITEEKNGKRPPIKNGILIYGDSKQKEDFVDEIIKMSGAVVKRFKHDPTNPEKTMDKMIDIAENSEKAFKHSDTRTILVIDDLYKMLTDKKTEKGIDLINEFKGFIEDISKKFHTTIITTTDRPLNDFEPASIASQRLGIHIDLKDGISDKELEELKTLKAEIKRLNDKSEHKEIGFKYLLGTAAH